MESAGKRRRSRTDDSLISAFTALRDSSIIQTGPKRPRGGGMWNFTPDPPFSKKKQSKSSLRKRSESNSLLRSTLRNARKQPVPETSEGTPHTDMVQTVKEFIEAGTKVRDLVPPKAAASKRYQLTPTPVTSSPRSTRSSTRKSMDPSTPVPETPSTHTNSSSRILEGLSSISKPPSQTTSVDKQANITEQSLSLNESIQPSSSNVGNSTKPPSPPEEIVLEPLDNEEDDGGMDDTDEMGQDRDEEVDEESDHVVKDRVHKESSVEDGSQTVISNERLESARKTVKQKQTSRTKHKPPKTLPRSLIKNLFTLFSKRRLTKDAMDLVMKFSELYLKQASHDLAAFATHAGRKTMEVNDVVLLLHRQRALTDRTPFEYLVNTHLPLEYSQELLPCAMAGKTVTPHAT